jgi:hypothetical protein
MRTRIPYSPDRGVGGCTGITPVPRRPDRSGPGNPHWCWSRRPVSRRCSRG